MLSSGSMQEHIPLQRNIKCDQMLIEQENFGPVKITVFNDGKVVAVFLVEVKNRLLRRGLGTVPVVTEQ